MAARHWVGGTDNWNGTAGTKWATTSGGAGGAAVPTASDDVFFDANSGANTITISGSRVCKSLTTTGFTGTMAGVSTPQLTISGNITLGSGMTNTLQGTIIINANSTITTNNISIYNLSISGTRTITLGDNLNISNNLTYLLASVVTMSGSFGWTTANFYILTSNNISHTLVATKTYTVTSYFESIATTSSLKHSLISSSPGTKAIFTLNYGATQNVGYTNATDIDSSLGQTIWTFNGVVTTTNNWNVFTSGSGGVKKYIF